MSTETDHSESVSPPALTESQQRVQGDLDTLIAHSDPADEPVPGEARRLPSPSEDTPVDWLSFTESLCEAAEDQTSVLSKSRALSVAGMLFADLGDRDRADVCLTKATEGAPRMAVAALLHRSVSVDPNGAAVRRSCESSMRQASQPAARNHATMMLLKALRQAGHSEEYATLLDNTARHHPEERAISLLRLVHRIAQNQSLAGVELIETLRDDVLFAEEVFSYPSGRGASFAPRPDFPHRSRLYLLRAARLLHNAEYARALEALSAAGVSEDVMDELEAGSLAVVSAQGERLKGTLLRWAGRTANRSVLRRLAVVAAFAQDSDALRWVLHHSDPGSGTFQLLERSFLAALSGQSHTMTTEERRALFATQPSVALALGPPGEVALRPQEASDSALLVQLGAHLRPVRADDPERSELADVAISELERRGREQELVAAYRLGRALSNPLGPSTIAALEKLLQVTNEGAGGTVLALLSERVLGPELALPAYRDAMRVHAPFAEAVLRAELCMGPSGAGARDRLVALIDSTKDPVLAFARTMELLFYERARDASPALEAFNWEELLHAVHRLFASRPVKVGAPTELRDRAAVLFAAQLATLISAPKDLALGYRDLLHEIPTPPASLSGYMHRFLAYDQVSPWAIDGSTRQTQLEQDEVTRYGASADPSERALYAVMTGDSPLRAEPSMSLVERACAWVANILAGHLERAVESHQSVSLLPLASTITADIAELCGAVDRLASFHLERINAELPDVVRRFSLERLVDLDERRGDRKGSEMWQRTISEQFPEDLEGLLRMEELRLEEPNIPGVAALRERIAARLPPADRPSYALLAGADALARSDLKAAHRALLPLLDAEYTPTLALRGLWLVASERRDDALLSRLDEQLFARATTDLDRASSALSIALCRSRLGRTPEALIWSERALAIRPKYLVAAQLVHHLIPQGDSIRIAEALESFAQSAFADVHKTSLFQLAAEAWRDAEDQVREAECLEMVLASNREDRGAFQRLRAVYDELGHKAKQRALLTKRLTLLPAASAEFLELTLGLAELLVEDGQAEQAKQQLEEALLHHPRNAQALRLHAHTSAKLGEHESAERSLVALRDRLEAGPDRTAVLRSLARLYSEELGQWERAMDAYQAVLAAAPDDRAARGALVDVYARLGLGDRATTLQTELIVEATSPDAKRNGALKLAILYESVSRDLDRAAATLERARTAWPLDADVLEASVRFIDQHGGGSRGFILDRAGKDAHRRLEEGRLNAGLLDTLARVAALSDAHSQSEACLVARAAYLGQDHQPLRPGGLAALSEPIEELIAPRSWARPLRHLFRKLGPAMDAAFAVDLTGFGARHVDLTSSEERELDERIQKISEALGQGPVEVLVADSLGARCLPIASRPSRLLIGAAFGGLLGKPRDYLLLRAFKLQLMGAAALSRSRPEDRFPMIVALLHLFTPTFRPASPVEGRKVAQARALIEQSLARTGYDDDVPMLALEAIGALGAHGPQVGDAAKQLASRAALLALGDPAECLEALAALEAKPLAPTGPSRLRFMESHAEARELVLFTTSSEFTRARAALGLVEDYASSPRTATAPSSPRSAASPRSVTSPSRPSHPSRAPVPPRRGTAPPAPPTRRTKPPEE